MRAWCFVAVAAASLLAAPGAHAVSATSLIGYWRMDDGSGTTARDGAGKSNGTLRGFTAENFAVSPSVTPWRGGRIKGSLDLDGTDDRVSADDTSNVWDGITGALTAAAWVRADTTGGWRVIINRQKNDSASEHWFLALNGTTPTVIINPTSYTQCASSVNISTGTWYHLALVWDRTLGSNQGTLYVDGVARCNLTNTGTMPADSTPVLIGGNANGTDDYAVDERFDGQVDEVVVYSRALSAEEIRRLAIGEQPEQTKYWIGSAGSWIDFHEPTAWSLTSGGTANTVAPGPFDSAIFSSGSTNHVAHRYTIDVKSIDFQSGWSAYFTQDTAPACTQGLSGNYFSGTNFGSYVSRVCEAVPDANPFDSTGTTRAGTADNFSAFWVGEIYSRYDEEYTFYTTTDDGVRLWVNGVRLIDRWVGQAATTWTGTIRLRGGEWNDIRMEFYEGTNTSAIKLEYSSSSLARTTVPASAVRPGQMRVSGAFTMSNGAMEFRYPNDWTAGSVTLNGGTFSEGDGWNTTLWVRDAFTMNGGLVSNPPTYMYIGGNFDQPGGTFGAPTTLSVAGQLDFTGGTFTHNSGTVIVRSGNAQTLNSVTAHPFHNLTVGLAGSNANLVGWWKLDETSITAGTTAAVDSSGNGYNGTYIASSGSPTPQADVKSGFDFANTRSVAFNGTNRQAVQVTTMQANLKPSNNMTVSAWYKATSVDMDAAGEADILTAGDSYVIRLTDAGFFWFAKRITGSTWKGCPGWAPTALDGNWHHVAGTIDSTNGMRFYFDGELVSGTTGDCADTSNIVYDLNNSFFIGRHGFNNTTFDFTGSIDDVRVYSAVLPLAEIRYLYAGSEFRNGGGAGTQTLGGSLTLAGTLNLATGTLAAGANTVTVGGDWTHVYGGPATFDEGTSTVILNGTGSRTIPQESFYNLTLNNGSGSWALGGPLTALGNLTITAGTLNTSASNYAVNVAGSFTSAGTFTGNSSTVTLDGTASGKSLGLGGGSIYNLILNGTNGVWTLASNTTVTNALTLTAGTLNGGSATLTVPGSWTKTSGIWQAGTGTVALTGSGAKTVPNETFNNLTINNGSGTYTTQGALTVAGDLTISAGSLSTTASNHALNLGGSLSTVGTFTPNSSTITLNGTASGKTFNAGANTITQLTVNGANGGWTLGANTNVTNLTLTNGNLNGGSSTLTVGGNWTKTSGTFTADTGTVSLTGSGARTVPVESWNNLTLSNGTWSAGATMNVGGNLTVSSGSLAPSANTVNVGGNLTATGSTFTPGTSTIVLNGGTAGKTFSVPTVHHLQVNGAGGWALQQALTVNGDFTLTTGTLDLNGYGLSVKGSLLRNGGTFTTGASTVTLNGTATGKSLTLGGASVGTLTINGTGGEWALTGATSVGTINLQAGTLKGGNQTLTVSGSWSNTGGTFTPETSTVVFSGAGTNSVPGQTFYSLQFNNASGTYNLQNALALDGDLTITAGTFNTNNNTVSVKGSFINSGTLNAGTTVLTLNGTASGKTLTAGGATLAGLTVNGTGGGWTLGSNLALSGDLAISAGTLAQSTYNMSVGGNWNRTGGTFTKGTGTATVTFTATTSGKTIRTGGQAFNHLTFNGASGGWTLQDAVDVDGDLTLTNGTFATGNFAVNVAGSLTRTSGTFSPGTSLITLDGASTGKTLNPGVALDRLTVSGSGGEWTLGAATTVTNALTIGPGALKTGAYGLTNSTTTTAASVASGGTLSVDGNGSAALGAGATVASGGTLALTATSGQTSTVNVGSGKTLTVNGTLTATTTGTKTIQASSGYYAFTVNGSGSAAALNIDGLEVKNTDANGLTINSASAATFTSFKNINFTNGNATASRYLSIDANSLEAFFEGLTFDATTTSNVRLVGHGTGTGTVRLGLRGNSSGAGAGESRDIDDDANGDDIADNPATNGAVITWIDYFTDMAGASAAFAVPAFDWNTFTYYATYIAMRDYDGASADYVYVRNTDGTSKGYGAAIPHANGDILGAPRPIQSGMNRYLLVLTNKGYIYKYQDTGAALNLLSNWPFTGGASCNANAKTPLIVSGNFAYWTCDNSTAANKIINKLDHTTANPNSSSLTQTQYSNTANAATAAPVVGTVSSTEYVWYVAQGSAFAMPTGTMSGPLSDTSSQSATTVSGRLALYGDRLYFGDDNGKLWVKKADSLFYNYWTCQDLTTHGGSCTSANCKIASFTVGFKTGTSTYPRVYWGDADGHVYSVYDDLNRGCVIMSGFPVQPGGTSAITAAPVFHRGNIVVGNAAGNLYVINQRNGSGSPEVAKSFSLGSAISSISLDSTNSKYIVLTSTRAYYVPMYGGTDSGDPTPPTAPPAPDPSAFFILTDTTYTGGLGSRAAADAECYSRMSNTDWKDRPLSLDSTKIKAFLCDSTTCTNLSPNTTYKFAVMGNTSLGGATFTTDGSGVGPNDSADWSASDRFGASYSFWANRATNTATAWGTTPASDNCENLTSNAGGSKRGRRGTTANTNGNRWNSGFNTCDGALRLVCFMNL